MTEEACIHDYLPDGVIIGLKPNMRQKMMQMCDQCDPTNKGDDPNNCDEPCIAREVYALHHPIVKSPPLLT